MKVKFNHEQEVETSGILAIKPEEASTVLIRYADHEVRLKDVTVSEVMQAFRKAKSEQHAR